MTGIATKASTLLGELKRRQVIQVAVVYAIVGAGVAEAADVFLGNLAPQWLLDVVLILVLLGFPIAIVLAWAYDLTPRGLVRDLGVAGHADTPAVSADPRAVAVLPFNNLSDDPENEYFADGVTDDILTALTLVEGVRVTSRTSVMRYKGSDKDTPAIARELGVGTVLVGSVRRSADRVRVTVQLVDAKSDGQIWAANYDRELEDVFAVQSDIAENVARALSSRLSARGRVRLKAPPTRNIEAYELLARARHAYLQVTQAHIDHGMTLIRRALELDPDYGEAWAHLAIAHFVLPYFSKVAPASVERSAREAIDRAFALDEGLPEAHVARAMWRFNFRYDWEGAERDFGHALVLNPSSADAYQWRGLMYLLCRNREKAIADGRKSVALDPLSFQTRSQLGQSLIWCGETEAARPIVEEIVQEDPTNTIAHWSLGVLVRETDPEQALRHFDDALRYMDVPLAHASRSLVLRQLGRDAEADAVIAQLEERARGEEYVSPFALALSYFGKEDLDTGFRYLEKGLDDHDFLSLYMRIGFGALKAHPRYRALAHRVWPDDFGLVEA